ncbi:MAG: hypothetical protein BWY83_01389 [bacterium ADurb.Bin478]|nr:MAG: hypothetical protein BWY83_01389 [bacterium ADurb.Bin478]
MAEQAADLAGQRKKPAGFFRDHAVILIQRHRGLEFEFLVQGLAFAHLQNAGGKAGQHPGQQGRFHIGQGMESLYEQSVAGENGGALLPFFIHRLAAVAQFVMIHDVVVHQGEIVHQLQRQGGGQGLTAASAHRFAG